MTHVCRCHSYFDQRQLVHIISRHEHVALIELWVNMPVNARRPCDGHKWSQECLLLNAGTPQVIARLPIISNRWLVYLSLVSNRHKPKFFRILLFFHILKAYVRIYQLAKFRVLILINLWIIADSNSVQIVLSPLEKLRSVTNPAPRACAQGVSASCSHRRAYKWNTLNVVSYRHNQSRSSICGGFTLRALGNHAWYRHKGIRIRVLNVLVH